MRRCDCGVLAGLASSGVDTGGLDKGGGGFTSGVAAFAIEGPLLRTGLGAPSEMTLARAGPGRGTRADGATELSGTDSFFRPSSLVAVLAPRLELTAGRSFVVGGQSMMSKISGGWQLVSVE